MAIDSHRNTQEADSPPEVGDGLMVVCPVCEKMTSSKFMWHNSDDEAMCMMCHHHRPKDAVRGDSGAKLTKATSQQTEFFVKIGGTFAVLLALVVGSIALFYKPKPLAPPPLLMSALVDKDGKPRKAKANANDVKTADGKAAEPGAAAPGDGKTADGKAKDAAKPTVTAAAALAGRRERMAATVQALISELPQHKGNGAGMGDASKVGALAGAGDMASSLGLKAPDLSAANATNLNPNQKTKEKLLNAKDSALAMAGAVIDKNDADGTKTANALAKLGAVSTMFADVATKLTEGATGPVGGGGGGGGGNSLGFGMTSAATSGSLKLEGDILEAQGRAGYDVMDLMQREADAEGRAVKTIKVGVDLEAAARKAKADRAEALERELVAVVKATTPKGNPAPEKSTAPRIPKKETDVKVAKLNDTTIKLKDTTIKLNSLMGKLNDTTIRLNPTDMVLGGKSGVAGKFNDTTIRLNSTAIQLKGEKGKFNDLTIRLNATAVRMHDPLVGLNVTSMQLRSLITALDIEEKAFESSIAAQRVVIGNPGASPLRRTVTVMKAKALPSNFAATAGLKSPASGGKGAGSQPNPDLPVLILSMRGEQLFESNSAVLRKGAEIALREMAAVLICRAHMPMLVRGCTDGEAASGTDSSLPQKRAEAIRDWLLENGCILAKHTSVQGRDTESAAPRKKSQGGGAAHTASGKEPCVSVTVLQEGARAF